VRIDFVGRARHRREADAAVWTGVDAIALVEFDTAAFFRSSVLLSLLLM
jgi:hypothetical protein